MRTGSPAVGTAPGASGRRRWLAARPAGAWRLGCHGSVRRRRLLAQGHDAFIQPALVAGRLVLVDQATGRGAVQQRHCHTILGGRCVGVTGPDRRQYPLDSSAKRRPAAGIAQTVIIVLARTLDGLWAIGQGKIPSSKRIKRPRTMRSGGAIVNHKATMTGR